MKCTLKNHFILFSLILLFSFCICSCNKGYDINEVLPKVDNLLSKKVDAFSEIEKAFDTKKIVFLGSGNNNMVNDHIFLDRAHIEALRKKGLKYILIEGETNDLIYNDKTTFEEWVSPYYPWTCVDVQYDNNNLGDVVRDVNEGLSPNNQIVIVGLETGIKNFGSWEEEKIVNNYRDSYMADIAKDFIDISEDNEKILVLASGEHGIKREVKRGGSLGYKWKPLGCFLNDEYGNEFVSYVYYSLSGVFEPFYLGGKDLEGEDIKQKFLTIDEGRVLQGYIPFMNHTYETYCDGFFVDKNTKYGIKFGYKMSDKDVRKAIIEKAIRLDEYIRSLKGVYDYSDGDVYKNINEFLRCVYYIDLYYGEQFEYTFWNPKTKFKDAVKKLDLEYEGSIAEKNDMNIIEYQLYIGSLMNRLDNIQSKTQATKYYEQNSQIIDKCLSIYPEDVWTDYFIAAINYKMENYEEALKYCDFFINNKASLCSQTFPEVCYMAIDCCEQMGEKSGFYRKTLARTSNEYNIEIQYFPLVEKNRL